MIALQITNKARALASILEQHSMNRLKAGEIQITAKVKNKVCHVESIQYASLNWDTMWFTQEYSDAKTIEKIRDYVGAAALFFNVSAVQVGKTLFIMEQEQEPKTVTIESDNAASLGAALAIGSVVIGAMMGKSISIMRRRSS